MLSEDNNSVNIPPLPLDEAKTPKDESANYPLVTLGKEGSIMDYVSLSSGMSLDSIDLTQLRWAYVEPWGWDWYYFLIQCGEDLHALWAADPNDPNDVAELLSGAEPYAFWADVTLPSPFYGDNATTTVHLRALDDFNDVKSKIPLTMYLSDKTPDNMTLTFLSEWFVISEDPNFHGHYQDGWGNCYTVIYMPIGTHPDVNFPDVFGDFNADDKVDFYDFALLANHWQDSIYDPNTNYDAMYEEPNDWDGEIRMPELGVFADNWLWEEGGAMRGSGMDSGSSLDSGLTEELYTAALPEQLEPEPEPEPQLQPEPEPELQSEPEPQPEPAPEPEPQLTEEDIEELAKWMEELWLTDEQVREQFSEAEWLEFIETVRETPIY